MHVVCANIFCANVMESRFKIDVVLMIICSIVEDRKMMCTQGLRDYDWIYSLKILAHFRSKVLEDFLHYVTQINCLTGAIISETYIWHILRRLYLTTIRSSTVPTVFGSLCLFFSCSWQLEKPKIDFSSRTFVTKYRTNFYFLRGTEYTPFFLTSTSFLGGVGGEDGLRL